MTEEKLADSFDNIVKKRKKYWDDIYKKLPTCIMTRVKWDKEKKKIVVLGPCENKWEKDFHYIGYVPSTCEHCGAFVCAACSYNHYYGVEYVLGIKTERNPGSSCCGYST